MGRTSWLSGSLANQQPGPDCPAGFSGQSLHIGSLNLPPAQQPYLTALQALAYRTFMSRAASGSSICSVSTGWWPRSAPTAR